MKINSVFIRLMIGGGLMVLLFFLITFKSIAVLGFKDGDYYLIKERASVDFSIKNKVVPKGIILNEDWKVEEVIIGDFTNNGIVDVGIYLWKKGSFGDALPFWLKENDDSYKQHLFVYEKTSKGYKSVWNSSNLPYINTKTFLADVNNDGENELIVLEQPYNKPYKTVAVWKWDEWGFKNFWRSEPSNFYDLKLQ